MRIGLVGAGRHANAALLPAIREAGLDLVAVAARTPDRAAEAARRWGAERHHAGVEALLDAGGLDGVVVAVPPSEYASVIARCVEAGVPVFAEKPGGASSSELFALAGTARAAGVEVLVGYMKRFAPAYWRAHELIRAPEFGAPSLAHFTFVMGQFGGPFTDLRYYLTENPVHMIDLARFLVGELTELSAVLNVVDDFGVAVSAVARTDGGAVCSFALGTSASFAHRGEAVDVYGRGAAVQVENVDTCTFRPAGGPAQVWRPNYTLPWGDSTSGTTMGFVPALRHFRDVVAGDAVNASDLESAARTLQAAERLYGEVASAWSAAGR